MNLRDYQQQAIDGLDHYRDLIYLATGSGKSVIFKEIARQYLAQGKKVCFVVYGKSIVEQAAIKHFTQITKSICMVMGASKFKPYMDLYCCSVSTLGRNEALQDALIRSCDVFIIDEAHNATSDQYKGFLNSIPKEKPVIGLTATPFWIGNRGHSYWDNVVHPITTQGLIKKGYLVMPRIFGPPENMVTKDVKSTAGEFNNKQLFQANDSLAIYGNILESWKKYAEGKRTIGFGINKDHAKTLADMFSDHGIPSGYADAETSQFDRMRLIRKLERKDILALFNVNIFSTGVDVPSIECALMARPTRSLVLWIQQVGRALRLYEGKDEAIVIDCGGNCVRLGHPLNDFPANLEDKKPPRQKIDPSLETKICPECAYVTLKNSSTCLACGYKFNEPSLAGGGRETDEVKTELEEYKFNQQKAEEEKKQKDKETKDWVKSKMRDTAFDDEIVFNSCRTIAEQMIQNGWKKNSFFFKIDKKIENAEEYIRFPQWYLDIRHTKNSSQKSDLDYNKLSQQVEALRGTLVSSTLKKVTPLK